MEDLVTARLVHTKQVRRQRAIDACNLPEDRPGSKAEAASTVAVKALMRL